MLKTAPDRMKLVVEVIEIAEKVSNFLPIIVFSYAGLTLVFAVIDLVEPNIVTGIVLSVFAGFGYISYEKDMSNKKKMETEIPNIQKFMTEMRC